jgi:1-phosphofructokinase family hexose kinase
VKSDFSIITVGLCPAWDVTCYGEGLEWGEHKLVTSTSPQPAGKALNISRALAWMGEKSIAAGLWGQEDYQQMLKAMSQLRKFIKVRMTAAEGSTRRNITVVDTRGAREMHLRHRGELATKRSMARLKMDLEKLVKRNSICVFAGLMPEGKFVGEIVGIIEACHRRGAMIVVDTSGQALREIVDAGICWLIKPNVAELCELVGRKVRDEPVSLAKAGAKLLEKVEIVLISRGRKGAIAVTRKGAWTGRCVGRRKVLSTVGCGDYLLAGFLKGLEDRVDVISALQVAIKVATAKAWGWSGKRKWPQVLKKIKVEFGQPG